MKYKQSKIAYLLFLILMMGIATYDQFRPRNQQVQIVLENKPNVLITYEALAKLK